MVLDEKRSLFPKGCFHPVFLALAALMAYFLIRSVHRPPSDFAGYYFGGTEVLRGRFANAYDLERLNKLIAGAGYPDVFVSYAPFPPFTALVFAPFLLVPMSAAKLLFDGFSCLLLLFTLMRARVFLGIPPLWILFLPFVFFIPVVNNLYFGQSYLLLCSLLLEGFMAYRRKQLILSSALWGLAVLFKVFPGIILIFLLLRKRYKEAFALAMTCLLLLLVSVLITGWDVWKYYVLEILPKINKGELNDSFAYLFQSAFMLLKRLFVSDALLNPHPLTDSPLLFGVLLGLFKALVLTAAAMITVRIKNAGPESRPAPAPGNSAPPADREFDAFSIWIMASMLISPNGSSYSLVLLIIPFLALFARKTLSPATRHEPAPAVSKPLSPPLRLIALLLLAVACWFPVYRLEGLPAWEQFPRLYLLLLFFALLLLPLRQAWHTGLWCGLSVLFIGAFLIGSRHDPDQSTYFFTSERHSAICDFDVRQGTLFYTYQDGSGLHRLSTGVPITASTSDSLYIKDKQIFYRGQQLTHSPDSKKKPLLVEGAYILYLSDKNRGPGFYTIRKFPLPGH